MNSLSQSVTIVKRNNHYTFILNNNTSLIALKTFVNDFKKRYKIKKFSVCLNSYSIAQDNYTFKRVGDTIEMSSNKQAQTHRLVKTALRLMFRQYTNCNLRIVEV